MALIVTATDVLNVTGATVTTAQVTQAQEIISIKCGRDLDDSNIFANGASALVPFERDRRLLRKAVCFQAAWLTAHPDAFTAMDVTQYTADGTSAVLKENAMYLAPLARTCLRRLSWQRTRSIHVDRQTPYAPRDKRGDVQIGVSADFIEDPDFGWTPFR